MMMCQKQVLGVATKTCVNDDICHQANVPKIGTKYHFKHPGVSVSVYQKLTLFTR